MIAINGPQTYTNIFLIHLTKNYWQCCKLLDTKIMLFVMWSGQLTYSLKSASIPDHNGGQQVLSPLSKACSLKYNSNQLIQRKYYQFFTVTSSLTAELLILKPLLVQIQERNWATMGKLFCNNNNVLTTKCNNYLNL